jgi:hypothetical protein
MPGTANSAAHPGVTRVGGVDRRALQEATGISDRCGYVALAAVQLRRDLERIAVVGVGD